MTIFNGPEKHLKISWHSSFNVVIVSLMVYTQIRQRSQVNQLTSAPPPSAFPSIAATLTRGSLPRRVRVLCMKAHIRLPSSGVLMALIILKSAPEQNVPSLPSKTRALPFCHCSSSSTTSASFTIIYPVKAFLRSGLQREITAIPLQSPVSLVSDTSPFPKTLNLLRVSPSSKDFSPILEVEQYSLENVLLRARDPLATKWKLRIGPVTYFSDPINGFCRNTEKQVAIAPVKVSTSKTLVFFCLLS